MAAHEGGISYAAEEFVCGHFMGTAVGSLCKPIGSPLRRVLTPFRDFRWPYDRIWNRSVEKNGVKIETQFQ